MKKRLDVAIYEKGLSESREKAKALIMAGLVYVNGQKSDKPGTQVKDDDLIEIRGKKCPYVSRGGLKLEKAIDEFDVDTIDKVALDIGVSTGGFTDFLLQHGAKKVYAIDVGYGQIAYALREDDRVILFERMNFRTMDPELISEKADLVVMDVSFISIFKLTDHLKQFVHFDTEFVFLIKPQFEAGRDNVGKKGIIRDKNSHVRILSEVIDALQSQDYALQDITFSPITGSKGNIEFLAYLKRNQIIMSSEILVRKILNCVEKAHEALNEKNSNHIQ